MRVLVADDNRSVRRAVRRLLDLAGITVVAEAADGLQAINLSMLHRPDTLILDIELPKLTGFEVVARLYTLDHQPAVIVLSAHDERSYVRRAVEMGIRAYLVKGATDEDLIPAIHAVAAGRSYFSPAVTTALADANVYR